mmetsp:Transcript_787/g.2297  ORF Transcript_787/g.2297 Transcript_787/m.2297 type:complete len:326 (+) Transcript_787:12-989(+)
MNRTRTIIFSRWDDVNFVASKLKNRVRFRLDEEEFQSLLDDKCITSHQHKSGMTKFFPQGTDPHPPHLDSNPFEISLLSSPPSRKPKARQKAKTGEPALFTSSELISIADSVHVIPSAQEWRDLLVGDICLISLPLPEGGPEKVFPNAPCRNPKGKSIIRPIDPNDLQPHQVPEKEEDVCPGTTPSPKTNHVTPPTKPSDDLDDHPQQSKTFSKKQTPSKVKPTLPSVTEIMKYQNIILIPLQQLPPQLNPQPPPSPLTISSKSSNLISKELRNEMTKTTERALSSLSPNLLSKQSWTKSLTASWPSTSIRTPNRAILMTTNLRR